MLTVAGIPLTLAFGATGTCAAVGLAAALGLALVYHNVRREIHVDLGAVLEPPLAAAALTLAGYLAISRLVDVNALAVAWRTAAKGAYATVVFFALAFLMQPRTVPERWRYVWQLVRQSTGR